MWNSFRTDQRMGTSNEITTYSAANGDLITAYVARPAGDGPFPGLVLVHHAPGFDEFYLEFTHRFANHGYVAICPNLYHRYGHGTPDDVAARSRVDGGVSDDQVVADCDAAARWLRSLPTSNGKVGILGTCSGGRHALLVASRTKSFDAVIDLWGGGVVATEAQLTPKRPVAVLDYTKDLAAPLLGIFGNDDNGPSPAQVNRHEEELIKFHKPYDVHRYDGAGHGFFYYDRANYRQAQTMDAWGKIFPFLQKNLR